MKKIVLLVFIISVVLSLNSAVSFAGTWKATGHWEDAGFKGVVCEQRIGAKEPFKVKAYERDGNIYRSLKNHQFWPKSCREVTTTELQKRWNDMGMFVEDQSFVPDGGSTNTMRRWRVQ